MLKRVSQTLFLMGSVIAVGSFGYTLYLQKTSPPGFCPINPARPFMWAGVIFLLGSLGLDFWISRRQAKARALDEGRPGQS